MPTPDVLRAYAGISSRFRVDAHAELEGLRRGIVVPVPIEVPYAKDAGDDDPPDWPSKYDLSSWALFVATDQGRTVGACAVARGTPSRYFESSSDEALLWDIRVAPEARGHGVGKALIEHSAAWARRQRCSALLIETQDTNVAACRLYLAAGCTVLTLLPGAYEELPDDVLVVWRLQLM